MGPGFRQGRPSPSWVLALVMILSNGTAALAADPLPRRGMLGAQLKALDVEARTLAKVEGDAGVVVVQAFPGSTAEALGLKAGDVITAVNGEPVAGIAPFVAKVGTARAGEPFAVAYVREGEARQASTTLKPRPNETLPGHKVEYGFVTTKAGRLRTILTYPDTPADKRFPALFVIQGLGGFSVENIGPNGGPYVDFIKAFSGRGYATFRVEKPGQGDSEGGPTRDADFEAELDGYRRGLAALKASPHVDPDRVVIFGHSMGGVMGPLVAAEDPVRGIAVYGTVFKTWYEYFLENTRRQMALAGDSPAEIDRQIRRDAAIQQYLLAENRGVEEIAKAHPDLKARLDEWVAEGVYLFGRHVAFFRQLAGKNLPEAWSKFDGHALAGWGVSDFVSTREDHEMIAALVNKKNPGRGTFIAFEGLDHGFHPAETPEASHARLTQPGPQPFAPAYLEALLKWADQVTANAKG